MKLPRISISFPGQEPGQDSQRRDELALARQPVPQPFTPVLHEIVTGATALNAVMAGSALTPEDLARARRRIASIQLAWQDFQSNLEEDRLVLQLTRRAHLLDMLGELNQRGVAVAMPRRGAHVPPGILDEVQP